MWGNGGRCRAGNNGVGGIECGPEASAWVEESERYSQRSRQECDMADKGTNKLEHKGEAGAHTVGIRQPTASRAVPSLQAPPPARGRGWRRLHRGLLLVTVRGKCGAT